MSPCMYVYMYSMGKAPTVHVWSTDIVDCSEPLLSLGKGFFHRAACALEFSTDSQCMYLCMYESWSIYLCFLAMLPGDVCMYAGI